MATTTREAWDEQNRHDGDRLRLFSAVQAAFDVGSALYPGSFVDIAPSFVIDDVTYVDSDRRAARFFADEQGVEEILAEHRGTANASTWRFVDADYREELPLEGGSVDLVISLYAGLVSDHCTRYLRTGGLLLANTSHGDASVVALDGRFRLVAAITARDGEYRVRREGLDRYLQPKDPAAANADRIRDAGRGIPYTTPAFAYVFELSSYAA